MIRDPRDLRDPKVLRVNVDLLETKVPRVMPVLMEIRALRERKEILVRKEMLAFPELMVFLETLAPKEIPVTQELTPSKDPKEKLVNQERKVIFVFFPSSHGLYMTEFYVSNLR